MRRAALTVVALGLLGTLVVRPALADDQRSVERLVKGHVASLAKKAKDDQLGLAKDPLVVIYGALERDPKIAISDARGGPSGNVAHAPGDAAIGVDSDHGVAWFQLPYSVDITPTSHIPSDPSLFHTRERFGGVAVLGKDGWQLAVVMYARLADDALMIQLGKDHHDAMPSGDPRLTGDKGLDGVIAGWIKTGFAPHAATDETLVASGTSGAEYQTGDAAKALAKAWDGLRLRAAAIDSRTFADGVAGFARVRVAMPVKAGGAVEMTLGVTAIWQDKEWRWVSLQFSGTHF